MEPKEPNHYYELLLDPQKRKHDNIQNYVVEDSSLLDVLQPNKKQRRQMASGVPIGSEDRVRKLLDAATEGEPEDDIDDPAIVALDEFINRSRSHM